MLQVTSKALENVRKVLRLSGFSSGLVDFDDEHLQQSLDISRMIAGSGVQDGWGWRFHTLSFSGAVTDDYQSGFITYAQIRDAMQLDADGGDVIWLMRVAAFLESQTAGFTVSSALVTVSLGADARFGAAGVDFPVYHARMANQTTGSLCTVSVTDDRVPVLEVSTSGGIFQQMAPGNIWPLPIPIYATADPTVPRVNVAAVATTPAGVGNDLHFPMLFWAGPRGLRPPGVA